MAAKLEMTVQVQLTPELWETVARWINQNLTTEAPTPADMASVAATLFHVAAIAWKRYDLPAEVRGQVDFDEALFLDLARQMWQKAVLPPAAEAAASPVTTAPDAPAAPEPATAEVEPEGDPAA